MYVKDKDISDGIFYTKKWPMPAREEERGGGEEDGEDITLDDLIGQFGSSGSSARHSFENIDGCFSYQFKRGKEEPVWIQLCNFEMVELKTLYIFKDPRAGPPTQRLQVRRLVNPDGHGTMRIVPESECFQKLTTEKYLEVEVLMSVQSYKTPDQIASVFTSAHGTLMTSELTPGMLREWVAGQIREKGESLDIQFMISYFGRQFDSETFVAGNCAVSLVKEIYDCPVNGREYSLMKAEFKSLQDAGVAVMPKHFLDANVPITMREFPRIMTIEQPWVRYAIHMNIWINSMPDVFQNNEMAAKAVFAAGVMGLHAGKIWNGEHGVIGGMPFVWAYSPEHHTGKTAAASLVNSMLGMTSRGLWGGDASKPALFERISQQACLSVVVDDVVIKADQNESKMFMQFGRSIHDRTSRAVFNKVRYPESSCIFTSNSTINDSDSAFVSRMLLILFAPLMSADDGGNDVSDNFRALQELSSSLLPDYASILFNGHLDGEAIQDVGRWIGTACGKTRDRMAQNWGLLTYYMLALTFMSQPKTAQVRARF